MFAVQEYSPNLFTATTTIMPTLAEFGRPLEQKLRVGALLLPVALLAAYATQRAISLLMRRMIGGQKDRRWTQAWITEEDVLETYGAQNEVDGYTRASSRKRGLQYAFLGLAVVPLAGWGAVTAKAFGHAGHQLTRPVVLPACNAISFLTITLAAAIRPLRNPQPPVVALVLSHTAQAAVLGTQELQRYFSGDKSGFLTIWLGQLGVCVAMLVILGTLPIRPPLRVGDATTPSPSPEDASSLLDRVTYAWLAPLFKQHSEVAFNPDAAWSLSCFNRAAVLSRRFELQPGTLRGRLVRASARDVISDVILALFAVALRYLQPYSIQRLLEELEKRHDQPTPAAGWSPAERAYLWTFLAVAALSGSALCQLQQLHFARQIGVRLRSELTSLIYRKLLKRKSKVVSDEDDVNSKLPEGSDNTGSAGPDGGRGITSRIYRRMLRRREQVPELKEADTDDSEDSEEPSDKKNSGDTGRIGNLVSEDARKIQDLGQSIHLLCASPLEVALALLLLYNLMGQSALVGFAGTLLAIPLQLWLGKRQSQISAANLKASDRRLDAVYEYLDGARSIKAFGWSTAWIQKILSLREEELACVRQTYRNEMALYRIWTPGVVLLITFWYFTKVEGKTMTVAIAFTAFALNSMLSGPMTQFTSVWTKLLEGRVSVDRIDAFLHEDEAEVPGGIHGLLVGASDSVAIRGNFFWAPSPSSAVPDLSGIDIQFPQGLSLISGATGSGKSSLLAAMLGEMRSSEGAFVQLPLRVSFASQHPWLQSQTIKDNIVFGFPLDEKRYRTTLWACALLEDLSELADGDLTHIGERGINLSGGQQARIALARALYAPTSVMLLDDVLSAVDAHTIRHLLDCALTGPLASGRTIVLVTHQFREAKPYAAYRVHLRNGSVKTQGSLSPPRHGSAPFPKSTQADFASVSSTSPNGKSQTAVAAEQVARGSVRFQVYQKYFAASSLLLWSIVVGTVLLGPLIRFGMQYWLNLWGESSTKPGSRGSDYFLQGFALLVLLQSICSFAGFGSFYWTCIVTSRSMFTALLTRVVRAPLGFYETTPIGRISARFSQDTSTIDHALPMDFLTVFNQTVCMLGALLAVTGILPPSLVAVAFCAFVYQHNFRKFLRLNRDVNRVAQTTSAPLFSRLKETWTGVVVIRAFNRQVLFTNEFYQLLDRNVSFDYLRASLDTWLLVRTQLISALCILLPALIAIYSDVSAGLAGVTITSSSLIIAHLSYLAAGYGKVILDINALERIQEFLSIPQEVDGPLEPPSVWPSATGRGSMIRVEQLSVRYSPHLPLVLKDVAFEAGRCKRVAIVGRTGSGKSTLLSCFLRFNEIPPGTIIVDGIDISRVKLDVLRQRITLIPQEAALFSGTLRSNLDPLELHSDEECLSALARVHLPEEWKLKKRVAPGGGHNFSAGQRQLIALARALLRKSNVLLLDESTASLDASTDALVQDTLRSAFPQATVLTIAHRLRTVADYDDIVVLDRGRVAQFGTPSALLSDERGLFRDMVEQCQDEEKAFIKQVITGNAHSD